MVRLYYHYAGRTSFRPINQTFQKHFGIYFIHLLLNWNKEIILLPSGMVLFSICKDFLQRKIIYNKGQTKHVSFKTEI